jgi:transposase
MTEHSEAFVAFDTSKLRNAAVWVPDEGHEAMRDVTRARETAVIDLREAPADLEVPAAARPPLPGEAQHLDQGAYELAGEPEVRVSAAAFRFRGDDAGSAAGPGAPGSPGGGDPRRGAGVVAAAVVTALMAMRGIDLIAAATLLAEIGDLSRFRTPHELMAYLGLVPSEDSTSDTIRRGPITKAGNGRARRMLVECSWSYQHPPGVGPHKQHKVDAAPPEVREIAWKAQCRLHKRYRALIRRGKAQDRRHHRGRP